MVAWYSRAVILSQQMQPVPEISECRVGVLCYTSPLAFSMGGSKTTSTVFKSWCRMVGSQLLLLVMNVWFLRGFASSMGQFIANGGALTTGKGSIFLWMFCALAYLKCAQRFDSYLASIGLNVAQTGSSMGMELMMAARVISGAGSSVRSAGSVFGRGGNAAATGTGAAANGFASGFASRFSPNSYVRDAVVEGGSRMGFNGGAGFVGRAFGGIAARNGATLNGNSISSVAARAPSTSGTIAGDIADRSLGNYMPQMINSGYSDCTVRITYKATMHSDDSVVYGNSGNPNEVVMLWKRSSQDYYDTLVDDAHIFTYAVELVKLFSDAKGNYANVEFIMQNDSDKYYVKAELNKDEGVYYVVGHVADKKDATHFIPVKNADGEGLVIVKGLEDDAYTVTEVRTDNGYTLLKDNIKIVISQVEATELCDIYSSDLLGLVQNDPRYAAIIKGTGNLKNMPQPHLEHHLLTASATVDSKDVNMLDDDGSANAIVPLKVINTRGFDLPQTGDSGTMAFSIIGILLMACAAVVIVMVFRKKCNSN